MNTHIFAASRFERSAPEPARASSADPSRPETGAKDAIANKSEPGALLLWRRCRGGAAPVCWCCLWWCCGGAACGGGAACDVAAALLLRCCRNGTAVMLPVVVLPRCCCCGGGAAAFINQFDGLFNE